MERTQRRGKRETTEKKKLKLEGLTFYVSKKFQREQWNSIDGQLTGRERREGAISTRQKKLP